jgi:hypothetical protein
MGIHAAILTGSYLISGEESKMEIDIKPGEMASGSSLFTHVHHHVPVVKTFTPGEIEKSDEEILQRKVLEGIVAPIVKEGIHQAKKFSQGLDVLGSRMSHNSDIHLQMHGFPPEKRYIDKYR